MEDKPNSNQQARCLNCDSILEGKYCHNCGLKVINPKDKSLAILVGDFFSALFLLESKFFVSLKMLFIRPATLPRTYISGVTNRYLKPIQFFLIGNLIYFLIPHVDTFDTSYNSQINVLPYSSYVKPIVMNFIEEHGYNEAAFIEEYERTSNQVAKLIVIIIVPLVGLIFYLLHFNRSGFYASDHISVALYFMSFIFMFLMVILPSIIGVLRWMSFSIILSETVFEITAFITLITYSFFLMKGVYKNSGVYSLFKAVIVTITFFPLIQVFRFILLFITLAAIAI